MKFSSEDAALIRAKIEACRTITAKGCWQIGKATSWGYPLLGFDGANYNARRVSYVVYVLPKPVLKYRAQVRTRCGNQRCINPEHLYLGPDLEKKRRKLSLRKARERHGAYPWGKWLRRTRLTIRKGVDFSCRPLSMAQQFRNAASTHGLLVSIRIEGDTLNIVFRRR